jgi:type IV pilus assembly protein PilB
VNLFFRIHGTLTKIGTLSKKLLPAVVSRVKILCRLDIAERRLPQDGRTRVQHAGAVVDLRISIIPTVYGESVVIRILDTRVGLRSLDEIGFNDADRATFKGMLSRNNGLILVTGPTGSGKSTTLYAALKEVRRQNVNIITVEDPVEYHVDGIEQIQANTTPGYDFARALRHILRHDPDVIMIGEIRDEETGKIAIESALTGHLVLTTLHTNDAASTVTRLMEMGVQPYLLSATLLGVLAQRLARRNCPHCMAEEQVEATVRNALGVGSDEVFYRGTGCETCSHTGFGGRIAVYELLRATDVLRHLIVPGAMAADMHQQAVLDGMVPLTGQALQLARQRVISLDEVYRVRLV